MESMFEKLIDKLFSRKLAVVLFNTILIAVNRKFNLGFSAEEIMSLAGLSSAYVLGQGYADGKKAEVKPEQP